LLLLLHLGSVLDNLDQFLGVLIAELDRRFLVLSLRLTVRATFRDHCERATIRVIDTSHIVVDLQVEGRLINLDLLENLGLAVTLAALRPAITALATAVGARIGPLAESIRILGSPCSLISRIFLSCTVRVTIIGHRLCSLGWPISFLAREVLLGI